MLPLADWGAGFLPESVREQIDFDPKEEPAEKKKPAEEDEKPVEEQTVEQGEGQNAA